MPWWNWTPPRPPSDPIGFVAGKVEDAKNVVIKTSNDVLEGVDYTMEAIDQGSMATAQDIFKRIEEASNSANAGVNAAVDGVKYTSGEIQNFAEEKQKEASREVASAAKFLFKSADELCVTFTGEITPKGSTEPEKMLCKMHELLFIPEHFEEQCKKVDQSVDLLQMFANQLKRGGNVSQALAQFAQQLVDVMKSVSTSALEQAKKVKEHTDDQFYFASHKAIVKKYRQQIQTKEAVAHTYPFPEIARQANSIEVFDDVLRTKRDVLKIMSILATPRMLVEAMLRPLMKFIDKVLEKTGIRDLLESADELLQCFIDEILNVTGLQRIKEKLEEEAMRVLKPLADVINNTDKIHGNLTKSLELLK